MTVGSPSREHPLVARGLPWLLGGVTVASVAVAAWYFRAAALAGPSFSSLAFFAIVVLSAACWLQAALLFSWRHATALALTGFLAGWLVEALGVRWGLIFGGPYHYAAFVGPLLPGKVPLVVPLAWYGLSHFALMLIALRRRFGMPQRLGAVLRMAASAGGIFGVLALAIEPVGTGLGAWSWAEPGAFYGTPLWNYGGWVLVGFVVFSSYGILTRRFLSRPVIVERERHARNSVLWGLLLFVPLAVMSAYLGRPIAVAGFVLGALLIAGWLRSARPGRFAARTTSE